LTSSLRNIPERHRSLRAILEHSWSVLPSHERDVFMRASVFRGGFGEQATVEVLGASLEMMRSLIEKSLLRVDSAGRYYVHEMLRQFAQEKLTASGDQDLVRQRHRDYFRKLAQKANSEFYGPVRLNWLDSLAEEYDNLHFALVGAIEHHETE